ncbi:ammonium transporter [Roseofilum casamattae]|uniref:ammonium transporter n=1 Tax=Roseofilum casamattae TaxID=3082944 RepID=UPI003219100B
MKQQHPSIQFRASKQKCHNQRVTKRYRLAISIGLGVILALLPWGVGAIAETGSFPADLDSTIPQNIQVVLNTIWVIFASTLVFFMNAGFAMLETGFCRHKSAVNILAKNLIVFALSSLAFWIAGFAFMFGDGNSFIGLHGFFLSGPDNSPSIGDAYDGIYRSLDWAAIPLKVKFFFQLVFAGTAATIVSGAVAERIKFVAFTLFSLGLVGLAYGTIGHWIWGNGWLAQLGFWDFAGSTVVHSVGGWAAFIGALLLGPRRDKYPKGQIAAIPGHNLAISTLGCLILWLGWFGFNPGSTLSADPEAIAHIMVTTNMAASASGLSATLVSWIYFGKPDLTMIINGVLAGLVAVTASCAYVNISSAMLIGIISGILVVFSVVYLEQWQIDDPVGAISVHLVCGIWGTLAVGLFSVGPEIYTWYGEAGGPLVGLLFGGGYSQLLNQLLGVLAVGFTMIGFSLLLWLALNFTVGIRVSADEELAGLDLSEHSMEAYSGFYKEQD